MRFLLFFPNWNTNFIQVKLREITWDIVLARQAGACVWPSYLGGPNQLGG